MTNKPNILVVDDDQGLLDALNMCFSKTFNMHNALNSNEALQVLKSTSIDVILLDIELGVENGLDLINPLKNESSFSEIIMLTACDEVFEAVQAMKNGAFDYVTKPFEVDTLEIAIFKALDKIRTETRVVLLEEDIGRLKKFEDLIYTSAKMQAVVDTIRAIASLDSTILIKGESGTGKELVARAIHRLSNRSKGPLVTVNCASIPDTLFESEMFGFERGSFTGAIQTKRGKMEMASGGTIFLDEISSLRKNGQASLLRAIEHKEIEHVGSTKKISLDIRIVSATNRNLLEMVAEGNYREDLYYRLNVIPVEIPPLRERKEDILVLVNHFVKKYNYILSKNIPGIDAEAIKPLIHYHWPGNVRELENLVERLVALGQNGKYIGIEAMPLEISVPQNPFEEEDEPFSLEANKKQFERELIIAALERAKWNRKLTARILGVHVNTLIRKINSLKISPPE
jgi:two-component system, NtrC family, response regulator AtoC